MAALLGTAHGASYTVGAPARSWGPGTNYTGWASGVTFHAGDQLVFKYTRGAQDVLELAVRVEAGRGGAPNAAAPSSPAPVAAVAPRAASSGPAMSSSTSAAAVQSLVGFSLAALVAGLVALF
nr:unnamed protein product [Digitaria exilis]